MTIRRININAFAAARPDAAVDVATDAVGDAIANGGEGGAAGQGVAGGHGVHQDVVRRAGVGQVKFGFVGREAKSVGAVDAGGDDGGAGGVAGGDAGRLDAVGDDVDE